MAAVDIKPGEEVSTVMMTMLMMIALAIVGNESDDPAVETVALLVVPSLMAAVDKELGDEVNTVMMIASLEVILMGGSQWW